MKKKNTNKYLSTKAHVKSKPKSITKSIFSKLGMLLGVIIPIAMLIAYSMKLNFFSITRILSIFILIISIAAYLKGEVIYSNPKAVQHDNSLINKNKNNIAHKKNIKRSYFSLKKGTAQVVLSMLIIILCTYLGQGIYKVIG